jgi:hypothetical protein
MTMEWAKPAAAGLRILYERQWSYLAWCVVVAVCIGATVTAAASLAGAVSPQTFSGPPSMLTIGTAVVCGSVLATPLLCAIYRAVLRPAESRFAYLRLGGAELRMAGILAPLALAWTLVQRLAAAAAPWNLAVILAALLLASPLTLVPPAILDRGRYDLGHALSLGRRYYWELFGINLLSWVMFLAMSTVIRVGWRVFAQASQGDFVGLITGRHDPLFGGQMVLAFGVVLLLYSAAAVIALAPAADAYRTLA